MLKRFCAMTILALSTMGLSSLASASLILETYDSGTATPTTIGGYDMTDFALTNGVGGSTSTVSTPMGDELNFLDINNNELALSRNLADSTDWWNNGELSDYDIYTTGEHLITIILPEDTFAFSFTVGADLGSESLNAWITATETNGDGIDTRHRFNVNRDNTPSFGIYAENTTECSTVKSITIEPEYWGVGNFSISRGSCTTSVPEPSSLVLLALGALGFGATRRKNKA